MGKSVRVLVVENSDGGTARSLEHIDRSIFASTITGDNGDLSWYLSSNEPIDCIVCDHAPPEIDAIATLKRVRESHPDLPFVLFTADGCEELASRAITAGVSEYIRRTPNVTEEDSEGDEGDAISGNDEDAYRELAVRILELVAARRADRARPTSEGISWMLDIDLHRLAGANFMGMCLIQNKTLVYVNEELASIFGYTREEMQGTTISDIVHEDDRETVIDHLQEREWNLINDFQYVFRGRRKDDSIIYIEITGERIVDSNPLTVFGMVMDVTNRKRREEGLERYRRMVNAASDIVYALDSNGRFTFVNDTAPCMTGYSRDEIIGSHVSLLLSEDDIEEGRNRIRELLQTDSEEPSHDAYEITLNMADGTTISCQTNITLLTNDADNGEFRGTVGVVRDITDEKELREKLETERDQLAALFQNVSEPTIQYAMEDGVPHVKDVNPAFEAVFGYSKSSVVGNSLDSFIIPIGEDEEEEANELNERVIDGEQINDEVYRQTTQGLRHFRLTNAPISIDEDADEGEEPVEGYAIYTDITERKQHEVELQRQNARLDEFASVVSHDLKQPLGIIYGRLSIIQEEYNSHHLDDINDALGRMETLIENVLTLARQGKIVSTPTPTSLEEVVIDAWKIAGTDSATLVLDGPLAEIKADGQRLQELFENLFRNAIEHAGPEATITVGMRDDNGFYVEDDGPGIPPESRDRVFEHSYSTSDNGTGIGLAIGQAIVEAHGWRITATDGTEGGARFEIQGLNHIVIGGG
jgi:PAS domain S-box-containing protein